MENLFTLLDSFGLGDPSKFDGRLAAWGDDEFQRFFDAYADSARNRPLIRPSGIGSTDVFPDSASGSIPLELIRQLCVYVNRFYIHDPILSLEDDFLNLDMNFERVIRTNGRNERISQFRSEFGGSSQICWPCDLWPKQMFFTSPPLPCPGPGSNRA